jgi:hypothetical protein
VEANAGVLVVMVVPAETLQVWQRSITGYSGCCDANLQRARAGVGLLDESTYSRPSQ